MPPRKRKEPASRASSPKLHGIIEGAGEVVEQPIVDTLEQNYMPYAMSVIMSRAIPEIDGFKPSHRKLLYTMYKMGAVGIGPDQIREHRGADDEAQPARRYGDL